MFNWTEEVASGFASSSQSRQMAAPSWFWFYLVFPSTIFNWLCMSWTNVNVAKMYENVAIIQNTAFEPSL